MDQNGGLNTDQHWYQELDGGDKCRSGGKHRMGEHTNNTGKINHINKAIPKLCVMSLNIHMTCAEKFQPFMDSGILHCHTSTKNSPCHDFQIFRITDAIKSQPCHPYQPCHVTNIQIFWIMQLIISQPCFLL